MIHYKQNSFLQYDILLRIRGSVVPWTLPRALLSGFFCFCLKFWNVIEPGDGGGLMWHPNPFTFFFQTASFILAFHSNQAYNRFWEARTQLQTMASNWTDASANLMSFDRANSPPEDTLCPHLGHIPYERGSGTVLRYSDAAWQAKIVHLFSLLHAVCISYLLSRNSEPVDLEVLGGINEQEQQALSETDDQAYLVSYWITEEMTRFHTSGGLPVASPIMSRTFQLFSAGNSAYNQACKIEDTPFPFPYVQLLHIIDTAVTFVAPVIIGCWVSDLALAIVLSCLVTGAFHALFAAAGMMENPFGTRWNDLPLAELNLDFIGRLKSLLTPQVSDHLNNLVIAAQGGDSKSIDDTAADEQPYRAAALKSVKLAANDKVYFSPWQRSPVPPATAQRRYTSASITNIGGGADTPISPSVDGPEDVDGRASNAAAKSELLLPPPPRASSIGTLTSHSIEVRKDSSLLPRGSVSARRVEWADRMAAAEVAGDGDSSTLLPVAPPVGAAAAAARARGMSVDPGYHGEMQWGNNHASASSSSSSSTGLNKLGLPHHGIKTAATSEFRKRRASFKERKQTALLRLRSRRRSVEDPHAMDPRERRYRQPQFSQSIGGSSSSLAHQIDGGGGESFSDEAFPRRGANLSALGTGGQQVPVGELIGVDAHRASSPAEGGAGGQPQGEGMLQWLLSPIAKLAKAGGPAQVRRSETGADAARHGMSSMAGAGVEGSGASPLVTDDDGHHYHHPDDDGFQRQMSIVSVMPVGSSAFRNHHHRQGFTHHDRGDGIATPSGVGGGGSIVDDEDGAAHRRGADERGSASRFAEGGDERRDLTVGESGWQGPYVEQGGLPSSRYGVNGAERQSHQIAAMASPENSRRGAERLSTEQPIATGGDVVRESTTARRSPTRQFPAGPSAAAPARPSTVAGERPDASTRRRIGAPAAAADHAGPPAAQGGSTAANLGGTAALTAGSGVAGGGLGGDSGHLLGGLPSIGWTTGGGPIGGDDGGGDGRPNLATAVSIEQPTRRRLAQQRKGTMTGGGGGGGGGVGGASTSPSGQSPSPPPQQRMRPAGRSATTMAGVSQGATAEEVNLKKTRTTLVKGGESGRRERESPQR